MYLESYHLESSKVLCSSFWFTNCIIAFRLEFGVALLRGLGGNLGEASKELFAKEVFQWCGGTPHGRRLTCTYYNKERDKLEAYTSDIDDKVFIVPVFL